MNNKNGKGFLETDLMFDGSVGLSKTWLYEIDIEKAIDVLSMALFGVIDPEYSIRLRLGNKKESSKLYSTNLDPDILQVIRLISAEIIELALQYFSYLADEDVLYFKTGYDGGYLATTQFNEFLENCDGEYLLTKIRRVYGLVSDILRVHYDDWNNCTLKGTKEKSTLLLLLLLLKLHPDVRQLVSSNENARKLLVKALISLGFSADEIYEADKETFDGIVKPLLLSK